MMSDKGISNGTDTGVDPSVKPPDSSRALCDWIQKKTIANVYTESASDPWPKVPPWPGDDEEPCTGEELEKFVRGADIRSLFWLAHVASEMSKKMSLFPHDKHCEKFGKLVRKLVSFHLAKFANAGKSADDKDGEKERKLHEACDQMMRAWDKVTSTDKLYVQRQLRQHQSMHDLDALAELAVETELAESGARDQWPRLTSLRRRMRSNLAQLKYRSQCFAARKRILDMGDAVNFDALRAYATLRGRSILGNREELRDFVKSDHAPRMARSEAAHRGTLSAEMRSSGATAHEVTLTVKGLNKAKSVSATDIDTCPVGVLSLRDSTSSRPSGFLRGVIRPLVSGLSAAMAVATRILNVVVLKEVRIFQASKKPEPFQSNMLQLNEMLGLVKSLVICKGFKPVKAESYSVSHLWMKLVEEGKKSACTHPSPRLIILTIH